MNLKTIIFTLSASVILAGCFHVNQGGTEGFTGSFYDLVSQDAPVQCTWESQTDEGLLSGVSYVAGERVRSESTMTGTDIGDATFNSIIDQQYVYSWSSLSEMGTKMSRDEGVEVKEEVEADVATGQIQPLDQQIEFNCSPWTVDESVFEPPVDIQFQDLSVMFQGPPIEADDGGFPCAICADLPSGEAKDQCQANCQ